MLDVILKSFDAPDETRVFKDGTFEITNYISLFLGSRSLHQIAG